MSSRGCGASKGVRSRCNLPASPLPRGGGCAKTRGLHAGERVPLRGAVRCIEVSDDQKGPDKGFGPKKPRATFGDVMLGIPAGRGGEQQDRPKGDRHRGERASASPGETPPSEPPRREPRKPERRKPQGPLVVVRRASGAIETRGGEASEASEPVPATESAAAPESAAPAPVEAAPAPTPVAPRSPLYEEVREDQSFAEMYEAHAKQEGGAHRKMPRVGERVTGTIFQLGADTAFLTLNGRTE